MTDDGISHGSPRLNLRTNSCPRAFQFSLLGLFAIVTVPALILATFFGVGRLAGMSTTEIIEQCFGQLVYSVPLILVWAVGFTIAIRRLKRNRVPATLTVIALGGLMLTMLILQVVQMLLIHWVNSGTIGSDVMSWSMPALGIFYAVSNVACWILVIVAIFVRRPPDDLDIKATVADGDPLQADI